MIFVSEIIKVNEKQFRHEYEILSSKNKYFTKKIGAESVYKK